MSTFRFSKKKQNSGKEYNMHAKKVQLTAVITISKIYSLLSNNLKH